MDIKSGSGYPSSALSNFAPHTFEIDGIKCASMEGFLQSLKFKNPKMQECICTFVGKKAKSAGSKKNWQKKQVLYWQGVAIKRDSGEYQDLLDRAYDALAQNTSFQKALLATNDAALTHSIGRNNPRETVLTQHEFISRLLKIRSILKEKKEK